MDPVIASRVEACFQHYDGDGDFICREHGMPYEIVGPGDRLGNVIFTTKPHSVLAALSRPPARGQIALIGGYGLPERADLELFRRIIGPRSCVFLGDLDPADLMIFVWLQDLLSPVRVSYLGISDHLMKEAAAVPLDSHRIPLSDLEQEAMIGLLEFVPDLELTIGRECANILNNNEKLEVESLLNGAKAGDAIMKGSVGD